MTAVIRLARVSDAPDIARLTSHLGYETDLAGLTTRLERILSRTDQRLVVADAGVAVVGWLHASFAEYIEADAFVVISGLVVDRAQRRQGVGRMLLEDAERWARSRGCSLVRLSSSISRTSAHEFYERLGYAKVKTQFAFARSLAAGEPDFARLVPRVET